jgi:N-acylglucosamine 2-epimerase/mannose-6-phosphate isomerase
VAFAERHGVDPASHATFNQVRDDGAPIDPASRTWPNTERVKAHVALYELLGRDPTVPVTQSTRLLLDRYLNATPPGSWIDNFDALGRPLAKTAPTSTLYHVFLAFAEVLRLEGRLVKAR